MRGKVIRVERANSTLRLTSGSVAVNARRMYERAMGRVRTWCEWRRSTSARTRSGCWWRDVSTGAWHAGGGRAGREPCVSAWPALTGRWRRRSRTGGPIWCAISSGGRESGSRPNAGGRDRPPARCHQRSRRRALIAARSVCPSASSRGRGGAPGLRVRRARTRRARGGARAWCSTWGGSTEVVSGFGSTPGAGRACPSGRSA